MKTEKCSQIIQTWKNIKWNTISHGLNITDYLNKLKEESFPERVQAVEE